MSTPRDFPYSGRVIYSETRNNGNTYYGYITNQSEADRIGSKYGSKFVLSTNTPGTFVIPLGEYIKGSVTPIRYDPAYDTAKLNGISNLDLQTKIFFDNNFKKMATGGSSSNTAQTPPESGSQTSPGSDPNVQNTSNLILTYPIGMEKTGQDRIKFSVLEINKAKFTENSNNIKIESLENPRGYTPKSELGTVFLPVQPSITDQNTVEWGSGALNPIEQYFVNQSLLAMNQGLDKMVERFGAALGDLMSDKKKIGDLTGLGQLALVEQAVGVQGLFSRVSGQVLNPNLELLFRGPQLRPFNFSFKLSPRSKKEADTVKSIIKFFKKNMAVRKGGELFLKAPYVFGIEYQHRNELHKSINRIKECALQSCFVDYTPLGSYMTYDDDDHTMVSYTLNLQFQEIVPVYQDNYDDHPIGY